MQRRGVHVGGRAGGLHAARRPGWWRRRRWWWGFARGYAFLRDREIHVADTVDYQTAEPRTDSGQNSEPALSGDGKAVVFVHKTSAGGTQIRRNTTSGTSADALVIAEQSGVTVSEPVFSRDGSKIAYVETQGVNSAIVLVNQDGSGRAALAGVYDSSPSFFPGSADLGILFGPSRLTRNEIDRLTIVGQVHTTIARFSTDLGRRAVVSPDGARIAFEQSRNGKTRIFVLDVSSGAASARQLTDTGGNDTAPTWVSAIRIGFASDVGSASNVYEIDADTTTPASGALTVPNAAQPSFGG